MLSRKRGGGSGRWNNRTTSVDLRSLRRKRLSEPGGGARRAARRRRRRWTNSPWQMHHLALFAGKPAALRARRRRQTRPPITSLRATACARFGGNALWMMPLGAKHVGNRDFSMTTFRRSLLKHASMWVLLPERLFKRYSLALPLIHSIMRNSNDSLYLSS